MRWLLGVLALACVALWLVYQSPDPITRARDAQIVLIPLTGPAAAPEAEISGLAWCGDNHLVFLPQYRDVDGCSSDAGCLFVLQRTQVEDYLDGVVAGPLTPMVITVEIDHMPDIEGFEGFEAIAFNGEDAFLLAESETASQTAAHLFRGRLDMESQRLILDGENVPMLKSPTNVPNLSYESIVATELGVLALPEVHGDVADLSALHFSPDLSSVMSIPLDAVDYRLTDVTGLAADGVFWGLSVHWPHAEHVEGHHDSPLPEHSVERIMELRWTRDRIECERTPTVTLRSTPGTTQTRNWEGLVRLGDRGFLVVTDEHPDSVFAFVPHRFTP